MSEQHTSTLGGNPVALTGTTVVLEPLADRHWPGVLAVGLAPDLWRWTIERVESEADLRQWFDQALTLAHESRVVPFATVHRASNRVVGSTRFGNIDTINRHVEIGWTWVAPAWQRSIVNSEAKYLMLCHAFEASGCHRVELKTDALNLRSRGAIKRLGAQEEGIFRKYQVSQGGRMRETAWYSVIDTEWPVEKSGLERRLLAASTTR